MAKVEKVVIMILLGLCAIGILTVLVVTKHVEEIRSEMSHEFETEVTQ